MAEDERIIHGAVSSGSPFEVRLDGPRGRGVFANRMLRAGQEIHVAPCIRVPKEEYDVHCRHTVFEHYLFNCPNGDKLLALGVGSLFNHDEKPNVDYRVDNKKSLIAYKVCSDVLAGEELLIYYGANLWFNDNAKSESSRTISKVDQDEVDSSEDEASEQAFMNSFNVN